MVDTVDSKSTAMSVEVQILSRALRDGREAPTNAVIAMLPLFLEVLLLSSPCCKIEDGEHAERPEVAYNTD